MWWLIFTLVPLLLSEALLQWLPYLRRFFMHQHPNLVVSGPIIRAGTARADSGLRVGIAHRIKLALGLSLIPRGARLVVPPTATPLWTVKGWQRAPDGNGYTGSYVAAGRTWPGRIQEPYPGGFQAYIWYPPMADIRSRTSHGACFSSNGESGRYHVHFHTTPSSLDHAITSIERVLQQACNGRA